MKIGKQNSRLVALLKLIRFSRIYGVRRTAFKAAARMRIGRAWWIGRPWKLAKRDVGLIGCGQFGFATIGFTLLTRRGACIKACFDIDRHAASTLAKALAVPAVAESASDVIADPDVKTVYIASNHYSHCEYAIAAADAGKTVYVEKPVSVTTQQLRLLIEHTRHMGAEVFAGYNRPFSAAVRDLKRWCADVKGPLSLSCFIAGHQLPPEHWYRRPEEGTRVCGNIGHWLDLAIHLLSWRNVPDKWRITAHWSQPEARDDDLAITLTSESGDLVNIVMTARCEPFEGINETINMAWDDTLAKIDDFRRMTVWQQQKMRKYRYRPKDVGHIRAIMQPFTAEQRDFSEVQASTLLMLEIAEMIVAGDASREFSFSAKWAKVQA